MYNLNWPHWTRFDVDGDITRMQFGFMNVGNINMQKDFLDYLRSEGIKFTDLGNTLEMSNEMGLRAKRLGQP